MATVNKDFKVKHGLVVEGTTGTINGQDILTKKQGDLDYIVNLIGGTATSANTPETVVKRDQNGNFAAGTITADLDGTAAYVDSLSGHSTTEISEGTNKYFTDQRAVDANVGLWDEAGSAQDALNSANNYTNGEISSAVQQAENYADSLASNYDPVGSAQGAYDNAVADANSYTDQSISNLNLSGTYDALGAATTALNDAKAYTDQEVAALVDSAPALLDTLNELAAAIADNPNYASDVANLVGTKADTTYVDNQDSYYNGLAQGYADSAQTNAQTYADNAAGNAEDAANLYTDNAIINLDLSNTYDALGAATNAQNAAATYTDNAINALSTSDIEEGSNQYFTDSRARSSAADLLTTANLTNITITGTGSGLTITAENGVADSTTDDLEEGSTNLYFTDSRAVSALEAVTPNFVEIDLNSVAKQVASSLSAPVAGIQTAYAFDSGDYRSAEFLVKVAYGTHTEISKVMLTLDTSDNIAITEYAIVGTNGSASSISAGMSGSNVELQVTTANNNSEVTVVGTLLA